MLVTLFGSRHTAPPAPARRVLFTFLAVLGLACVSVPATIGKAAAQARSYELGAGDKLMLRVGEWRGSEGRYEAWADVGGEYVVGPGGTLSLPLTGSIPAAGKTPDALAKEIALRLQERVGLSQPLEASVEILEFRPVYVVGGVKQAGAYPFTPGLTVIQAIGLAGGLERPDSIFLNSDRHALTSLGDYEVLRLDLWRNLAQLARLEAELQDQDEIEMPERLADVPMADELIATEREIKETRETAFNASISQIESLETLLRQQIEKLDQQMELRARQVELAEEELAGIDSLMEKGLTVTSRQSSLARTLADLQANELELQTAKLRAEQRLNEAGRDKLEIVNEHRRELITMVRETRGEIAELTAKIETARALFAEASRYGTGLYRPGTEGARTYALTRRTPDGVETRTVDRTTALLPGDVLEVEPPELDEEIPIAPQVSSRSAGSEVARLGAVRHAEVRNRDRLSGDRIKSFDRGSREAANTAPAAFGIGRGGDLDSLARRRRLDGAGQSPVGRADEPVGRTDEPVGRADEPVSRADEPVSRADEPVSRADEPVSGSATAPVSVPMPPERHLSRMDRETSGAAAD